MVLADLMNGRHVHTSSVGAGVILKKYPPPDLLRSKIVLLRSKSGVRDFYSPCYVKPARTTPFTLNKPLRILLEVNFEHADLTPPLKGLSLKLLAGEMKKLSPLPKV